MDKTLEPFIVFARCPVIWIGPFYFIAYTPEYHARMISVSPDERLEVVLGMRIEVSGISY